MQTKHKLLKFNGIVYIVFIQKSSTMKVFVTILMTFIMNLSIAQNFKERAVAIENESSLENLIDTAGPKRLVMLGEGSHGTHEYYLWRDKISRQLIEKHNFNFIAVEGDFASLYHLNRYVKNMEGAESSARAVLLKLDRWPTWMWSNEEVVDLAEWLRSYNDKLPKEEKIGFYGMDVYDEWHSKKVVLELLKKTDNASFDFVKDQYNCFHPFKGESWEYARAVKAGKKDCAKATKIVVDYIRNNRNSLKGMADDVYFYLLQNALVFQNAEEFYRESVASKGSVSWNSRVFHMHETIVDLLALYGENSKGIVWAHNTHIGDASYTNMRNVGEKNIGQLGREHLGADNVFLIGFTSYKGKVLAAPSWGSPVEEMKMPRAIPKSVESKLNQIGSEALYIIFNKKDREERNLKVMGNRAVGVVYNPERDRRQFVPTLVPLRYDAIVFFKKTTALHFFRR